jgi:hypothetical protein
MKKFIILAVAMFLMVFVGTLGAEDLKFPNVSQKASVTQTVGLTDVTVTYHRPGVKERVIWGELVPYDKVWRTGANNATTIEFSGDVMVGETKVAAGKYGLFTIPGKEEWTFIISKQADIWGAMAYKESEDVVRIKAKPGEAPKCEWMRFGFAKLTDSSAFVYLHWEKLMVGFGFKVATKDTIVKNIEKTMGRYWVTPYRAADYAFNQGMLDKAKEYIAASIAIKTIYWNVVLKAKIYKKLAKTKKDQKMVIKILEQAVSLADELPERQKKYAKEAGEMLAELKGKKK